MTMTMLIASFADALRLSRIQLRHFGFHVDASVVGGFLDCITSIDPDSPLDISRLSSLECTVLELEGCLPIQRLLDAFVPSLQHLHITVVNKRYKLDLRKLRHLRKLSLDMVIVFWTWDDDKGMLSLRHVSLPLLQQKVALVVNLDVSEAPLAESIQGMATVDSVWAALPAIASVLVNLWYERGDYEISPRVRKESFVDVSDKFVQQMPLLANKLADTGGLRVLECTRSVGVLRGQRGRSTG
ncbi:hypothetical protein C8R45DRAFT_1136987 [Mycena sanguinolenta]|nr:hypothetical protein C8R45DRAFT_1136987 [Mycena sanguinolenta]